MNSDANDDVIRNGNSTYCHATVEKNNFNQRQTPIGNQASDVPAHRAVE